MSKTKRFDYVKFDENTVAVSEVFKDCYSTMTDLLEQIELVDKAGPSAHRAKAVALTKLEESFMWVGKMLRDNQVAMNGPSDHLPERSDSK